jgi:hypothetical protein
MAGTEVFPLAPVKFFSMPTPRPAPSACRVGDAAGTDRDRLDMTRKKGALIPALDAMRVDNTGQTVEETFAVLMAHVTARLNLSPGPKDGAAGPAASIS